MIEANELRIGNYVNEGDHVHFIDSGEDIDIMSDDFNPIPLTPEILEKCGFVKSGFYYHLNDVRLYEYHERFNIDEGYIFDFGMTKTFANIKHLHQLQNLYFALTGEELNVTL